MDITTHVETRLELDPVQESVRDFASPTLKLVGPSASGKTTALVERAARLVELGVEPESILCFVQDRRQAIALRDRLVRRLDRSVAGPSVLTFHAFAWSLLSRVFGGHDVDGPTVDLGYQLAGYAAEPVLLPAFDQRALVKSMLAEEDPARWPINASLLGSNAFAGEVRDFLLRAQERLETPATLRELARELGRPDWLELAAFFERYLSRLDDEETWSDGRPRVDFAGVLTRARRLIGEHPSVSDDLRNMYVHLLVDDFEEATRAEDDLLRALLPAAGEARTAVIAGDPSGSVFGYRGAHPRCLVRLETDEVLELQGAYRRSEVPRVLLYSHVAEEARGAVQELREAHAAGMAWGDMAIIMRDFRSLLAPLRRELKRAGVPHRVEGEALELQTDPVVRPILDLFTIACRASGHEERWAALLASELGGLSAHEVIQVRRAARLAGCDLHEACSKSDTLNLTPTLATKMNIVCKLVESACGWATTMSPDDAFWELWQASAWFAELVERGDDRRLDSLTTLADALARFTERRGREARLVDFMETLASAEFAPESVRLDKTEDAVTITTAHGAKGNEFELAVVSGCVEGMWPDPSRRGTLLDVDLLSGLQDHADRRREALEEEQRLFALATSRSRRLLLTGLRAGGSERSAADPSRFLEALVGDLPEENAEIRTLVLSPLEAEAEWRRTAADEERSPAERLAALWGLANLPGVDPDRWWWGREWTKNEVPVAGETKKTSYSRFSNYENCPLNYLLGQVLGLDPDSSFFMSFGGFIHSILEDAENGTIPKTIEALREAAKARWRPEQYPAGAVSAFLKRDAMAIFERYIEREANNGHETLSTEEWFEFPVRDWTVRGKIDRIDRVQGNGLRLIDYKTGAFKFASQVADDLQLATYLLACLRDPHLQEMGEPKVAELVFVRHDKGNGIRREGVIPKATEEGIPFDVATEERIGGLLQGIEEERFTPSPEAECRNCKFHSLCPTKVQGQELRVR